MNCHAIRNHGTVLKSESCMRNGNGPASKEAGKNFRKQRELIFYDSPRVAKATAVAAASLFSWKCV